MRKLWCLFALGLLFAVSASAQDSPKVETFVGYSYVRFNPGSTSGLTGLNLNGGGANVAFNPSHVFGIVADFGGTHTGNVSGPGSSGTLYTYLFGPRFSYRRSNRFTPFGQILVGGAHGSASFGVTTAAVNSFAMSFGGGLDVKVTDHIAVRPAQVDYLMTRFDLTGTGRTAQNNLRYSAGVVFRW